MHNYRIYKTLGLIVIGFGLLSSTYGFDFKTDCKEQTFVVTAYYSPSDSQTFYYKGSSVDEKILNGNGTHGASGKSVFNGMLAAPSTYAFGGKIYFPALGIGEISDRGGAIVHAGEREYNHDRIDIWMGKGEKGLIRALTFGKRTVVGYYCDKSKLNSLGITSNNSEAQPGINFDAIPVMKYFFDATLFIQELKPERTDIRVYTLQKYLMKFGYMDKKTGYFGPQTKAALCKYQLRRGITSRRYCGTFGKRTRYYMKFDAKKRGFLPDFGLTTSFDNLIGFAANYKGQNIEINNNTNNQNNNIAAEIMPVKTPDNFIKAYKKGASDDKVGSLQDMLRHYGFYNGDVNNIYDGTTINAVHNFQIAAGILKANDYSNPARGWMGPSTKKRLNEKRRDFQTFKKTPHPTSP